VLCNTCGDARMGHLEDERPSAPEQQHGLAADPP
jgi:hypothetical protein